MITKWLKKIWQSPETKYIKKGLIELFAMIALLVIGVGGLVLLLWTGFKLWWLSIPALILWFAYALGKEAADGWGLTDLFKDLFEKET